MHSLERKNDRQRGVFGVRSIRRAIAGGLACGALGCLVLVVVGNAVAPREAAAANAEDAPASPLGPPPGYAAIVESNQKGVQYSTTRLVPVTLEETYTVEVNGLPEQRTRTEQKMVAEQRTSERPWSELRVFSLGGKRLPPGEAIKRLPARTPVLLVRNGQPLDPFYSKFFKPDLLVIVEDEQGGEVPLLPPAPAPPGLPAPAPAADFPASPPADDEDVAQ